MKKLLIIVTVLALLAAGFIWFISDRDRGLWFGTKAIIVIKPIKRVEDIASRQEHL